MIKFESIDPTQEKIKTSYPYIDNIALSQKIINLNAGFKSWSQTTFEFRANRFRAIADSLVKNKLQLSTLMATEMGKPVTQGQAEVQKCADVCLYYAENAEKLLNNTRLPEISYQPLGVILGIMPWNFPLWQVFRFIIPTMMVGNVCIIKHAPNIPETTLAISKLMKEAGFDEDVFTTVFASHQQIEGIIKDNIVKGVSLTGSGRAGSVVASLAGQHLKKVVLELGGSDPFIVFDDADLDLAVETAVRARFTNAGQVCISAKRFFIHETIFDQFMSLFKSKIAALRVGDPSHQDTDMGPMARADLRNMIQNQVARSIELGATSVYEHDDIPKKGWFYPPTILTNVKKGMPVIDEETFGPVAVLIPFSNEEEVISLANDTPYGLGASIWTADQDRAQRCCHRIEAGAVFVNAQVSSMPELPFGGIKESGFGRELGLDGLTTFCNTKTIVIK